MVGEINFALANMNAPAQIANSFQGGQMNALALQNAQQNMQMNALKAQEAQRAVQQRNALADIYRSSGGDMSKVLQGLQSAGDFENAQVVQDRMMQRQAIGLKMLPEIARILHADPSDANIDALAAAYSQATGQDVSQFAQQLKQLQPEQRQQVALRLGQKADPKFQLANVGDGWQAIQYGPGGASPVGQKIPIADKPDKAASPYYQFIPTPQGIAVADARSGKMQLGNVEGRPVVKSSDDPALQGKISEAKESGKTIGEASAKSEMEIPKITAQAEETIRLVDELISHPGKKTAVGTSRLAQIQRIPGTEEKAFDIRLEQLKGKQFLEAFNSLRGGGQITEVEGKKATDALSRMNPESTEEEFDKAAKEFQGVLKKGLEIVKTKASKSPKQASGIPTVNARGWTLHTDGQGNRAYVSPDGREYEEVK